MSLSETLKSRGLVYQHSSETVEEITDREPRTLYWGVDPSADSMHVGQLQGLLLLRHFVEAGHKVIMLFGGATGLIGDPGGKNEERPLLDPEVVERNVEALSAQARKILGTDDILFVNNADWLGKVGLLQFLRDAGKYATINEMMKRDTVRPRIEDPQQSISYAEFSYMLLQAYDYLHLHETHSCDLQVGASDQWGNIVSGVDLIRKKSGHVAYALSAPLLIDSSTGRKFGKSEGGAVWLDASKTTPYQFYQFFFNSDDADVEEYLKRLTTVPLEEIAEIIQKHTAQPQERSGQKRLAHEATAIVHGKAHANAAEKVSAILFGDTQAFHDMDEVTRDMLKAAAPVSEIVVGDALVDVLVLSGAASSKREARQFIESGAVTLNDDKIVDVNAVLEETLFERGNLALLKRGKREVRVLIRA
jgi:tyrosyl-tRNA synthetase